MPRIIRDLCNHVGLLDVLPVTGKAWIQKSDEDLELLEAFLCDAGRLLPVVMLTETDESPRGTYKVSPFVFDASSFADDLLGLAHVVVMPRHLSFEWTKRVGRSWTAYNGAIRTFRPGLDFSKDDPYRHPLTKLDDIVMWEYCGVLSSGKRRLSEDGFRLFLKEKLFQTITARPVRQEDNLFYRYAKIRELSARNAQATSGTTAEAELREELTELQRQLEEVKGENNYVYEELAHFETEVQLLQKQRHSLSAQVSMLRLRLGRAAAAEIPIPGALDELEDWQAHVAGQLVLAPRALRAARKAEFRDPGLVYKALLLLANEYRDMRLQGGEEAKREYNDGLKRLKLTTARSISESRIGERGDEYVVPHPLDPDRKVLLDEHLRKGTDRDQRNILRIYFTWDSQEQIVIVGWLPTHLDTRTT